MAESALLLSIPFAGGKVADALVGANAEHQAINWLLLAVLGLLTIQTALRIATENLLGIATARMLASLRTQLY